MEQLSHNYKKFSHVFLVLGGIETILKKTLSSHNAKSFYLCICVGSYKEFRAPVSESQNAL